MAIKKTTNADTIKVEDTKAKKTVKKAADKIEAKEVKKAPAKKTASKSSEIVVQYAGNQISCDEVMDKVKDAWKNQFKQKVKDFVNVQIYIKPEDNKAYFVVNGDSNPEYFVELQ